METGMTDIERIFMCNECLVSAFKARRESGKKKKGNMNFLKRIAFVYFPKATVCYALIAHDDGMPGDVHKDL